MPKRSSIAMKLRQKRLQNKYWTLVYLLINILCLEVNTRVCIAWMQTENFYALWANKSPSPGLHKETTKLN